MASERDKANTQEDNEPVVVDQVEDRVQAEMKQIEGRAKEAAGQGMQNEELEKEGKQLKREGEREMEEQRQKGDA